MYLSDHQLRCLEQLAKDKGHTACFNCGSRSVGVHEYESDWSLGGSFQVVLECPECGADSDNFYISEGEPRNCGLDPIANLPRDVP